MSKKEIEILIKNINDLIDNDVKEFLQKHKNLDYQTKLNLFFMICLLKADIYSKIIKNEKKILKKLKTIP